MSKKIWITALAAVLAVGVGVGSVVVFGGANNTDKAQRSVSQEEHDKAKKELSDSFSSAESQHYNELKDSSEYDSIDDKYLKDSLIRADATIEAEKDYDNILLDLLKRKNMIGKDVTLETLEYSEDHKEYYDYIRALCRLYSDKDTFLTNEEIVRIEVRLEYAHTALYDEKIELKTNYNEEEVLQLQKLIRDTIGIEEPQAAINK